MTYLNNWNIWSSTVNYDSEEKKNDVLNQIIIWTCAGFWNYDFRKLRTTNNSNKLAKINESKITNSAKIISKKIRNSTKFSNQVSQLKLYVELVTWFDTFVSEIYIRNQMWLKVKFKVVHLLHWFWRFHVMAVFILVDVTWLVAYHTFHPPTQSINWTSAWACHFVEPEWRVPRSLTAHLIRNMEISNWKFWNFWYTYW